MGHVDLSRDAAEWAVRPAAGHRALCVYLLRIHPRPNSDANDHADAVVTDRCADHEHPDGGAIAAADRHAGINGTDGAPDRNARDATAHAHADPGSDHRRPDPGADHDPIRPPNPKSESVADAEPVDAADQGADSRPNVVAQPDSNARADPGPDTGPNAVAHPVAHSVANAETVYEPNFWPDCVADLVANRVSDIDAIRRPNLQHPHHHAINLTDSVRRRGEVDPRGHAAERSVPRHLRSRPVRRHCVPGPVQLHLLRLHGPADSGPDCHANLGYANAGANIGADDVHAICGPESDADHVHANDVADHGDPDPWTHCSAPHPRPDVRTDGCADLDLPAAREAGGSAEHDDVPGALRPSALRSCVCHGELQRNLLLLHL